MSFYVETEKKLVVKVSDSVSEYQVYSGLDELKAEEFDSCLEMVVTIVESLKLDSEITIDDFQSVWEVLENNSVTP